MKYVGRLLSAVTALLILCSLVIISGGLLGRPLLVAAVPTGSMVPALRPGDLIVVLPAWAVSPPGIHDIVVYRTPQDQDWIVHRIVDGNGTEGFVTRGDANPVADPFRVFRKDIAGVVPQWHGAPLRLPRLGELRMNDGPFSSPVVAGVALVVGIFLLLMDARPRIKLAHLRRRKSKRLAPEAVLSVYAALAATAFITTLLPAWTLSSRTPIAYEVVTQRSAYASRSGQYLQGEVHREELPVENPSPLPLLVVFQSDDPHLKYQPWWTVIGGKGSFTFTASIDAVAAGEFHSQLRTGVFLPLLPPLLLAALARVSMLLAGIATGLVPAVVILALAFMDARSRMAISRLKLRLASRLAR